MTEPVHGVEWVRRGDGDEAIDRVRQVRVEGIAEDDVRASDGPSLLTVLV